MYCIQLCCTAFRHSQFSMLLGSCSAGSTDAYATFIPVPYVLVSSLRADYLNLIRLIWILISSCAILCAPVALFSPPARTTLPDALCSLYAASFFRLARSHSTGLFQSTVTVLVFGHLVSAIRVLSIFGAPLHCNPLQSYNPATQLGRDVFLLPLVHSCSEHSFCSAYTLFPLRCCPSPYSLPLSTSPDLLPPRYSETACC